MMDTLTKRIISSALLLCLSGVVVSVLYLEFRANPLPSISQGPDLNPSLIDNFLAYDEVPVVSHKAIDIPVEDSEMASLMNASTPYKERLKLLHHMDWASLDSSEVNSIAHYLMDTDSSLLDPVVDLAIRNDLLKDLMAQRQWADLAAKVLIEGVADLDQHPLWREYLLQHYSIFIQDYFGSDVVSAVVYDGLKDGLVQSLSEIENGMAGTALLNIKRLQKESPKFVSEMIWEGAAVSLAMNAKADLASRIPALQVLPLSSEEEPVLSVESLIEIIESEKEHTLVKLAAVNFAKRAEQFGHDDYASVTLVVQQHRQSNVLSQLSNNAY